MTYLGCLGDQYTGLGGHSVAQEALFRCFFFQLYFNKKYVDVVIDNFTMHLIISKWFRIKKNADRREKEWEKEVKAKEETVKESFFTHLTM